MDFPRVLVIAPIRFNQQTGSGVTMGNLFRGWPLDAIAQIHSDQHNQPDLTVCTRYYYVPNFPIRQPTLPQTLVTVLKQGAQFLLGQEESLVGHWLRTRAILAWCEGFAPDVIYARPHDRPSFYTWLPRRLSEVFAIPYISRVLDDWPSRYENSPVFLKRLFWRLFLRRHLQVLFEEAAANVGISAEMCDAFGERYNSRFVSFHNCIDVSEWKDIEPSYEVKNEFLIAYMGSVSHEKELSSLLDLRDVLLTLRDVGHPVRLIIYGPDRYRQIVQTHLESPPVVVHGGCFPVEEKQQVLSQADLLVLPINFDEQSLNYVGYSFQTKLPEYMASGTPTLVYGPKSNPNVRYAAREGWGAVVDERDTTKLAEALVQLIESREMRATLGQRARDLAFRLHNAALVRQQFRQLIRDVACGESL